MFLLFSFFRAPWSGRRLVPPHSELILFPFYTSIYSLSNVHVYAQLSGFDTCPISPYLEWLWVVVKAEEHDEEDGPVRRRVLYCSFGSFLLRPLLHCARPFFQGH